MWWMICSTILIRQRKLYLQWSLRKLMTSSWRMLIGLIRPSSMIVTMLTTTLASRYLLASLVFQILTIWLYQVSFVDWLFWLMPTTRVRCRNVAKTQNSLKFAVVPQTGKPISAVSGPKFAILWGHLEEILLFNIFFPIVDTCLSYEDTARQSCAMVCRWRIFGFFCVLYFQRATCSTFQTCILNSH